MGAMGQVQLWLVLELLQGQLSNSTPIHKLSVQICLSAPSSPCCCPLLSQEAYCKGGYPLFSVPIDVPTSPLCSPAQSQDIFPSHKVQRKLKPLFVGSTFSLLYHKQRWTSPGGSRTWSHFPWRKQKPDIAVAFGKNSVAPHKRQQIWSGKNMAPKIHFALPKLTLQISFGRYFHFEWKGFDGWVRCFSERLNLCYC